MPSGVWGKRYIKEIRRLLNEWISDSPLKDISFKVIMIMSSLLLQKPSKTSKLKEHQLPLEQRLDLWKNVEFEELLLEGETFKNSKQAFKTINNCWNINKVDTGHAERQHQCSIKFTNKSYESWYTSIRPENNFSTCS